jgi:hypothetical protein
MDLRRVPEESTEDTLPVALAAGGEIANPSDGRAAALALEDPVARRAAGASRRTLVKWAVGVAAAGAIVLAVMLRSARRNAGPERSRDMIVVAPFRVSGGDLASGYLRDPSTFWSTSSPAMRALEDLQDLPHGHLVRGHRARLPVRMREDGRRGLRGWIKLVRNSSPKWIKFVRNSPMLVDQAHENNCSCSCEMTLTLSV